MLVHLLVACGAFTVLDELVGTLPRVLAGGLRENAERWKPATTARARAAPARRRDRCAARRRAAHRERGAARADRGDRVTHAKLGVGTVLVAAEDKAEVRFDDGTTRRLLQKVLSRLP